MFRKKKLLSRDVRDLLWSIWEPLIHDKAALDTLEGEKLGDWCVRMVIENTDEMPDQWVIDMGIQRFVFEIKILERKPCTKNMKHLYGEHAFLYDVFGCSKHRVIIITHDDHRYTTNATVFCPICNREKFYGGGEEKYPLEWKVVSDEEWKSHKKASKLYKKMVRRDNFRYRAGKRFKKIRAFWRNIIK